MATVTRDKKDALAALIGTELAESILQDAEKASAVLESQVAFKEDAAATEDDDEDKDEDEEDEEGEGEKKNTFPPKKNKKKEADEDVFELELDDEVMKEIAGHVDVSGVVKEAVQAAVKEALTAIKDEISSTIVAAVTTANVASKEAIVQDALTGKLRLVSYTASKSDDNVVDKDEFEEDQKARKSGSKKKGAPDPVKAIVRNMLGGGGR